MDTVDTWTGLRASTLRDALRMSNEAFAERLGVAARTVAQWSARPDMQPGRDSTAILDTALAQSPAEVRARFARLLQHRESPADSDGRQGATQPLRVVVAVVRRGAEVLMVRRRDSSALTWQFPAGIVKPGGDPWNVAVNETIAETGVVCTVQRSLGSRVHPVTGVTCDYLLCDYLSGQAANHDPAENSAVAWMDHPSMLSVVPEQELYPPVERLLRDPAPDDPVHSPDPAIAAAIIVADGSVLLVRRQTAEGQLSWQFPAGKVEPGEAAPDAAARETREEVGLDVEPGETLGRRTHPVTGRTMIYVACQLRSGTAQVLDTDELSACTWCPPTEIETYLPAGVAPPVLDYLHTTAAGAAA